MVSRRSHLRKAEARGAREHWGLEPYQQAAAAALTGDTIDLLKTAASLGSIEIGGNAPLLTKVIDAGFLEAEPPVNGRAVARITKNGLAALQLKQSSPKQWWRRRGYR
jgi:hypothetical protein